ncbi:hypothetical protein [Piscibacillus salipiscarius]|uniref:hypothetical protein n=1 Tax=Piscibacillus salipiscarius TaxID=299480 RepID=UPI0006CF9B84|nr:hypothetical protein [Piscibacillus salipiscarius]
MIQSILHQLKKLGVHSLISNEAIILEILEDVTQLDLVNETIDHLNSCIKGTEFKKVLLVCPREYLNQLKLVGKQMGMKGERVIYQRSLETPLESAPLDYEIWSPTDENSISFLSEVMGRSVKVTKKFLKSMMVELPSQYQTCSPFIKSILNQLESSFPIWSQVAIKKGDYFGLAFTQTPWKRAR